MTKRGRDGPRVGWDLGPCLFYARHHRWLARWLAQRRRHMSGLEWGEAVDSMTAELARDNTAFDPDRFRRAVEEAVEDLAVGTRQASTKEE